jgi:hypothetical protein
MKIPTEIRERAIELVKNLPQEMLGEAIDFLESLSKKAEQIKEEDGLNTEESSLIQIIQRGLSLEEQKRLDYLREQNEWSELTEAEYQELLAYEDLLENQNVERLEALMKLAKIRQVDLATLNSQFKLEPKPSNAI